MKFKDILATICIVALLALGAGYVIYDQLIDRPDPDQISAGAPIESPALDQTYDNSILGFGFEYPGRYAITQEIVEDYSWLRETRIKELLLVLEDQESRQSPRLTLYVNKEIPATRSDRTLTLLQDNNGLYLAELFEDQTRNEEQVRTFGSLVMSDNNVYTWEFVFDRGKYDYGPDLAAILSEFGIYEVEEAVEPVDEELLSL